MTQQEIKQRIEQLENNMFYMEMQNFINWNVYDKWEKELKELKSLVQ